MRELQCRRSGRRGSLDGAGAPRGDEVASIAASFDAMRSASNSRCRRRPRRRAAHREVMAGVAHDLRTPLTALHGHLEALALPGAAAAPNAQHLAGVALAQSDKVRRLSQQLFELATLQSIDHVLHRDRFRLDELVADTVQKFELIRPLTPASPLSPVALSGPPPGRVELDGDLQLIERALTNLIDNALRHARSDEPVRVSACNATAHAPSCSSRTTGRACRRTLRSAWTAARVCASRRCAGQAAASAAWGWRSRNASRCCTAAACTTLPAPGGGTRLSLSLPLA